MERWLIADTETTGLPICYTAPFTDLNNWPRIIELSWELCWSNGDTIGKECNLVKPDGWRWPTVNEGEKNFWKENGFSYEQNMAEGKPMAELLIQFYIAMNSADVLVCHNLSYDKPIIEAESVRYNIFPKQVAKEHPFGLRPADRKLRKECTKLLSTPILKLPGFKGDYAWPKLEVAYEFMYNKKMEGMHHASADVEATKMIYKWIVEMQDFL